MKLATRDIASFMKSPGERASAVLLYGPDRGLIRKRSRAIAEAILGKDGDRMNHVELTGEQVKADPALLRDELCALSLMGGRRVVTLQGAGDKLAAAVESALSDLKTTTYLIVEAEELSPSSSLRRFFESAERSAALACYRDEGSGLEDTLRTALAVYGLRATGDAMQYMLTHLGNDRGVTVSEIDKIALYMGAQKEVTLEIAMLLIEHNASEGLDDICHAVACGKAAQVHLLLQSLPHDEAQPVVVVRSLLRHFQRLELARTSIDTGQSVDQALAALRPPVFFKYAPPFKRALTLWNARALSHVLGLLLKTERELKSSLLPPALALGHALQQVARMAAG